MLCFPVRFFDLQTSKNPSILRVAPPMACPRPFWSLEPVTASSGSKGCFAVLGEATDTGREIRETIYVGLPEVRRELAEAQLRTGIKKLIGDGAVREEGREGQEELTAAGWFSQAGARLPVLQRRRSRESGRCVVAARPGALAAGEAFLSLAQLDSRRALQVRRALGSAGLGGICR